MRPKDCTSDRVNGLSLLDEVLEQAWYTFTKSEGDDRAFYYHQFKASRLWLDEEHEMNIRDFPAMLPIGLGTITATDGIEYNRELRAKDIGVKYYNVPNFEYDEEKQEFVKGEDGYPIETGTYTTIEDGRDFQPMGYSVYLPYTMRIPAFTKVYQPHAVRTEGDVTTVAFKEIEGDEIKAFTPYYVVVEKDTISLSTEAEVVCPIVTASKVDLQTFEFLGTTAHLDRTESSNKYILQSDGKWHNVTGSPNNVYIPAFRSYFQPKTSSGIKSLNMIFGDFDDTTGIDDKYQEQSTKYNTPSLGGGRGEAYDLNGRLIQGKPTQRGIYIKNGKKILVE